MSSRSSAASIPPLAFFRVVGVPTDGDGGVVVADVSASYNGPHRSPDLHCYVRKGANSVPVGMREIHDIVLRLSRRQDEIQRRLSDRGERFRRWVGIRVQHGNMSAAFRVTAVPVGAPLYVEKVFNNREVSRGFHDVNGTWRRDAANLGTQGFASPVTLSERPVLGGTAWISSPSDDRSGEKVIIRDGLIDIWFKWPWHQAKHWPAPKPILLWDWIVAASADVIASADALRRAVQSPGCEYGLQLELLATNGPAETPVQLSIARNGFSRSA